MSNTLPVHRILCVDDNSDVADSTALLLRIVGFVTKACYDGAMALRMTDSFRPNLCLLDLNMPRITGEEVAAQIARRPGPRPLLVALTAGYDEPNDERLLRSGFDLHLIKPVDPQKLIGMVEYLCRQVEMPV